MAGAFEVLCRIAKRELTHISARRHLAPSASVAGALRGVVLEKFLGGEPLDRFF